jgi:tRNA-specific adenosine deaminase 1
LQDRGNRGVEETIANQHVTLRGRSSLSDSRLHLRTKPGRPQSKPSISMSCTDKLSMWSVVGIQGSVLSRWIEPLFLSTLVIGVDHVLLQKGVTEELIRRCQTVLQDKIQHSPSVGRRIQVFPTTLKFIDSRESVQERLLDLKPNAQIEGPSDELDLVPAAGSKFIVICLSRLG